MPDTQGRQRDGLRDRRICMAVTKAEKQAIRALAQAQGEGGEYSVLLRSMSLNEIVAKAESIRGAFASVK